MLFLAQVVHWFFTVYSILLFVRILGSWIPELQSSRFMLVIRFYTDPYLNVFRRIIPPLGMMDLSPIVALFALRFIEYLFFKMIF